MLRVLLVDDEYIVLKGMEAMLSEQTEVPLQIFTTCDAVEALADLERIRPDVIVADINMPEIDGLTLIEKVRQRNPRCRFIICTGHDKVEYLHRAIRHQVAEYLLKPVDRTALLEKLAQLQAQKEQEQEEDGFFAKMCLLYRQSDVLLDRAELQAILPKRYYRLCVIAKDGAPAQLQEDWQEQFKRYYAHVLPLHKGKNDVFMLGSDHAISQQEAGEICALLLPHEHPWGLSHALVTKELSGVEALAERADCLAALADLVLNALPLALSQETKNALADATVLPPVVWFERAAPQEALRQYLACMAAALPQPKLAFLRVFADFTAGNLLLTAPLPSASAMTEAAFSAQANVTDFDSFCQETAKLFASWLPALPGGEEETEQQGKIERAVQYIRQCYREDISLDLVAGHVGLHPSYFSYLFKKKTGDSFLRYLHSLRLQEACRLMLERPGLSLESVGAMAGYRTATYFYKAFRQRFGTSPREWSAAQASSKHEKG